VSTSGARAVRSAEEWASCDRQERRCCGRRRTPGIHGRRAPTTFRETPRPRRSVPGRADHRAARRGSPARCRTSPVAGTTGLRGDDRDPPAVVEIDDSVATGLAGAPATRLQQSRRAQQLGAGTTPSNPQQDRIDPPHDRDPDRLLRQPRRETAAGKTDVCAIDRAARSEGVDVPKGATGGHQGAGH
jgi:hypothetical protein